MVLFDCWKDATGSVLFNYSSYTHSVTQTYCFKVHSLLVFDEVIASNWTIIVKLISYVIPKPKYVKL